MKRIVMFAAWTLLAALAAGCGMTRATLDGHDFVDQVADNIAAGIDEYHADDRERMGQVRARLAEAFSADIVAVAADPAAVRAKTDQFLQLLAKAEAAEAVEESRHQRLLGTLRALREVNDSLRDLATIRLGWRDEVVQYTDKLRKAVRDGSGK